MKQIKKILAFFLLLIFLFLPFSAFAHQPQNIMRTKGLIVVNDPEVSKAYYGELTGSPQVFRINSQKEFNLYVGLLLPKIPNIEKNLSADIYKINGDNKELLVKLFGPSFNWTEFYEPFGGDYYWQGPEYKNNVSAGNYEIEVNNPKNLGKYSLAIGEKEEFPPNEILRTIKVLPDLKKNFFGVSVLTILKSYTGLALIVTFVIIVVIILAIILIIKKIKKRNENNINSI